ncbi:hypothetical protein D3C81_1308070 [compost metagenome]
MGVFPALSDDFKAQWTRRPTQVIEQELTVIVVEHTHAFDLRQQDFDQAQLPLQ